MSGSAISHKWFRWALLACAVASCGLGLVACGQPAPPPAAAMEMTRQIAATDAPEPAPRLAPTNSPATLNPQRKATAMSPTPTMQPPGPETTPQIPASCSSQDDGLAAYFNLGNGYCLLYPERFRVGDVTPWMANFYGPPLDKSVEPVQAGFSIQVRQSADGQTLEQVVTEYIQSKVGNTLPVSRSLTTVGGEAAEIIEGLPGRTGNRQALLIHQDLVYHLVLYPVDDSFPQAGPDVEAVWQAATESLTFLPSAFMDAYAACASGSDERAAYLNPGAGYCLLYPHGMALEAAAGYAPQITLSGSLPGPGPAKPVHLAIDAPWPAEGRGLADIVDNALIDVSSADVTGTLTTIGGALAEVLDGLPGRVQSRHAVVVYEGQVYTLRQTPYGDPTLADYQSEAEALWQTVSRSLTFVPRASPPSPEVQIQPAPPQAEPGQAVTIHVTDLPQAVVSGEETACVELRNEDGQSRAGPTPLTPADSGASVAHLSLPQSLEPGDYRWVVFICGWKGTPDSSGPPPTPERLAAIPYTVTPAIGQHDQVESVPSPDGQWTAIVNQSQGSLDLQREADHETSSIFPAGSTVDSVSWSPDSHILLVVSTHWQRAPSGNDIQIDGPLEIWQIDLEGNQVPSPHLVFTSPTPPDEAGRLTPEQVVFGTWSPDGRFQLFWHGILSASIMADGMALWAIDTQAGHALRLAPVTLLNPRYQTWAPHSSALAFTAGGYRSAQVNKWLDVFDVASGQVNTVISDTEQIAGIVAWSPKGDVIAYAALPAAEAKSDLSDWMSFENPAIAGRRVYLLDPASRRYGRLNDADAFQDAPTWSEDGEVLYYVQREGESMILMASDPLTGRAQAVEESRRPAPEAVGYYGQSDWSDLLAYRPDAPRAPVPALSETYTDPAGRFALRYPAGWYVSEGWQSITDWREMPTFTSYPPDGPEPELGPFSGAALIAIQTLEAPEGGLEALLETVLAAAGPGQILGMDRLLIPFDRRALAIDGQPALRLETMGDFGTVNHVLLALDGTQAYVLRGQGDGRIFDAMAGGFELSPAPISQQGGTATGRVILGFGEHSPVADLPLWVGTQSQGEPATRTAGDGEFTLTGLPTGLMDVVDSHMGFQVPVSSTDASVELGLLKYPLFHPPAYYWWTAAPLPDPAALLEAEQPVKFSTCLTDPTWQRPTEPVQQERVWSRRPFSDKPDQWLRGWFEQPAVIYDSIDQFVQSFPGGPNLDPLAADWRYLLGLWNGQDIVADSDCSYAGPALEDLLARRQIEVWLLGYRATGVGRLDKDAVEYDASTLCDPAQRSCTQRPGHHFAVHVTPADGFQAIRFAGVEDVVAVHLVDGNGKELIQLLQSRTLRNGE
jgi:hypothetical protein